MNLEIANALSIYFETLYELNRRLIFMCGNSETNMGLNSQRLILNIIEDIPKMIPYYCDKKDHKLYLKNSDGLLEFKDQIVFLKPAYSEILNKNYTFLGKIKQIRNKIEHKMHVVKNSMIFNGSMEFYYKFDVKNAEGGIDIIEVDSNEFINLLKELNMLFSKLQKLVPEFAVHEHKTEYPYYMKLCRFDYTDFNTIYETNILRLLGKIMVDC